MKKAEYLCAFCNQLIQPNGLDPCFLDLCTSRDTKAVQSLYCHAACLNRVVTVDFPLLTQLD
jgi:hypothetical protein